MFDMNYANRSRRSAKTIMRALLSLTLTPDTREVGCDVIVSYI